MAMPSIYHESRSAFLQFIATTAKVAIVATLQDMRAWLHCISMMVACERVFRRATISQLARRRKSTSVAQLKVHPARHHFPAGWQVDNCTDSLHAPHTSSLGRRMTKHDQAC